MKTLNPYTLLGVALLGFSACDSKVESSRKDALESKADALDNQAATVRKDSKIDADDQAKQGKLDAEAAKEAAKAKAEVDKLAADQAAAGVRLSGDQAAKTLEDQAKATREQK